MARDLRTAHWHQMRKMRLGIAHPATQASGYPRIVIVISFAPGRRHHVLQWQTRARGPGPDLQPKTSPLRAFSFRDAFCPPNLLATARTHPDRCTYRLHTAAKFSLTTLPPPHGRRGTRPSVEGCLFRALKN